MTYQQLEETIMQAQQNKGIVAVKKKESLIDRFIKWFRIKRTVKKVNKALDIHLQDWQIRYIFRDQATPMFVSVSRGAGQTLTHVLFMLLNPVMDGITLGTINYKSEYSSIGRRVDLRYMARILFADDHISPPRQLLFLKELDKTRKALDSAGIKTNKISVRRTLL